MLKFFKITLWTTFITLMLTIAGGAYLLYDYKRFLKTPLVKSERMVVIKSGDTVHTVMKRSYDFSLANQSPMPETLGPLYLRYLLKTKPELNHLKIGEYQVNKGMGIEALLKLLVSGKSIMHKVQFIEGKKFSDMKTLLNLHPRINHGIREMTNEQIMLAVGEKNIKHPEGMFFPDTFLFPNRSKDIDVLKQSYDLMQKNLAEAWEARDPNITLKTPYELLILASIIEKETGENGERNIISGVFNRRLAIGMKLQTDPTVIYGMGSDYQGRIFKKHLKEDTPYNTYVRKGLPPTPIAMPSKASLMAAGQPDKGSALYFVANGSGGHTFSNTYAEHQKAVLLYRKMRNN